MLLKQQSDVSNFRGLPIDDLGASQTIVSITGETVQLYYYNSGVLTTDAGQAAGTVVVGQFAYGGVKNGLGSMQATSLDTSLSFTSTALTNEKPFDWSQVEAVDEASGTNRANEITKNFSNGDYVVDYKHGIIYGKKASTGSTLTSTAYKIHQNISGGTTTITDNVNLAKYGGSAVSATNPVFVKEVSAGTDVVVLNATGAAAINTTTAVAAEFKIIAVICHFSAAPTTSENFVIKLDSVAGAAYDTTLYSVNPSLSTATDIAYIPDGELKFKANDEVVVTFTNTELRTYGLSIYYQLI